jgi:uncharacterized protein (TIGR02246 family)
MKQLWLCIFLLVAQVAHAQGTADSDARRIAGEVLERLDHAWTAGDGPAFAGEFADDADIINIFGGHFHGKAAITDRMQAIFDTLFKGSVHRSRTLESVRNLSADIIVAVSSARVDVPSGPQAPQIYNRQTFVLVRESAGWKIIHWHNTPIREQ